MALEMTDGLHIAKRRRQRQSCHSEELVDREVSFLDFEELDQQLSGQPG
jgi:hypothetical protein